MPLGTYRSEKHVLWGCKIMLNRVGEIQKKLFDFCLACLNQLKNLIYSLKDDNPNLKTKYNKII